MSTRVLHRQSYTSTNSLAPSYTTQDPSASSSTAPAAIELDAWTGDTTSTSSSRRGSILSNPPPYSTLQTSFQPTVHLQVQTAGKPWLSLPLPLKPVPIPIFDVDPGAGSDGYLETGETPCFVSIRPERGSGSCYLAAGSSDFARPLSTTTYRFGPGRPPSVSLFRPSHNHNSGDDAEEEPWDTFTIVSPSLLSRTQRLHRTRLGTLEWRYLSRSERKAVSPGANSVLALDKICRIAVAGGSKEEERRRTVALFVRGEDTRTPGSGSCSAGNGGRLMVDLGEWMVGGEDDKTEREMALVMVVTTVLVMLKKEVDRRRAAQIAIMANAGS